MDWQTAGLFFEISQGCVYDTQANSTMPVCLSDNPSNKLEKREKGEMFGDGRIIHHARSKNNFRKKIKSDLSRTKERNRYTLRDDMVIAKYYEKYGADWKAISAFLPGRSCSMIKNRYYSYIRNYQMTRTLEFIRKDLEAISEKEIEKCPWQEVEAFHIFLPR